MTEEHSIRIKPRINSNYTIEIQKAACKKQAAFVNYSFLLNVKNHVPIIGCHDMTALQMTT